MDTALNPDVDPVIHEPRHVDADDGTTGQGMTAELHITGHPKSVIGTPAWRGPYGRLRVNEAVRIPQAADAWELIQGRGMSVRQAARHLGLSVTTTWRRARWYGDWTLNSYYGLPPGPKPHQRGTRACPSGRPIILPLDAPAVFRQLLDGGVPAHVIAASWRAVPVCVRDIAVSHMIREGLDEDGRAWFDAQRTAGKVER